MNVMDHFGSVCHADDPDLSAFQAVVGKLFHYDGWADQATGPYQPYNFYQDVRAILREYQTDDFYKLCMIPGMSHCGGGTGCTENKSLRKAAICQM